MREEKKDDERRVERERGWPRFLGRRGQSEKTEMACSFRIICEPRRGLMSVFHDYRGNREACRRKAERERERRRRGRRRRRGGKGSELYFIWQRDCISQNKHRSGRASAQENVGVNRGSPFLLPSPIRPFFHPLLPPFPFRFLLLLLGRGIPLHRSFLLVDLYLFIVIRSEISFDGEN